MLDLDLISFRYEKDTQKSIYTGYYVQIEYKREKVTTKYWLTDKPTKVSVLKELLQDMEYYDTYLDENSFAEVFPSYEGEKLTERFSQCERISKEMHKAFLDEELEELKKMYNFS